MTTKCLVHVAFILLILNYSVNCLRLSTITSLIPRKVKENVGIAVQTEIDLNDAKIVDKQDEMHILTTGRRKFLSKVLFTTVSTATVPIISNPGVSMAASKATPIITPSFDKDS